MEVFTTVLTQFGADEIQEAVIAMAGFMAVAVSIGGIPLSFNLSGGVMKGVFEKGMGMFKAARNAVGKVGKKAAGSALDDARGAAAAKFVPGGSKSQNLLARVASGAYLPGKRSNLKIAAAASAYKNAKAQNALALLSAAGVDSGTRAAELVKGINPIKGINTKDKDISRQLALIAIKTEDGKALNEMFASSGIDHGVMLEEVIRNFPTVKKTSAGLAALSTKPAVAFLSTAGKGTFNSKGELEGGNLSHDTLMAFSAKAMGDLKVADLGGQDVHSLQLANQGLKDVARLGSVTAPGMIVDDLGRSKPGGLIDTTVSADGVPSSDLVALASVKNVATELTTNELILQQSAKRKAVAEVFKMAGKEGAIPKPSTADISSLITVPTITIPRRTSPTSTTPPTPASTGTRSTPDPRSWPSGPTSP